ncbi:DUF4199 domain-containing protein [Nonlabens xiamenensis]|uniref:DUF4199 domain-containing protein n=1 Tax=Nonlabens xiamenensis TaxID=2341043 RepID=UPI000F60F2C2|nr:DUF4199 domain-containing protein [Nonlabens xiamenensis]
MTQFLTKPAVKFGLIGFLIYMIAYFVMWQVNLALFLNPLITYPLAISVFVFGILAQVAQKKLDGGYISFSRVLVVFIITVVIGYAGYAVAAILIFNVIDPGAKTTILELTIEMAMEMTNRMLGWFGLEAQTPTLSKEQMRQSMSLGMEPFGIPSIIIGYVSNLIICTIGGLISSLVIKNEKAYEFE